MQSNQQGCSKGEIAISLPSPDSGPRAREKYVLFSETRSRYEDAGGMLPPSEIPEDGLCRVIVDSHFPFRAGAPIPVPQPLRTREERIAYLRATDRDLSTYAQIVSLASARLCGSSGWLWCVGETRLAWAEVLSEAAGRDIAFVHTGPVHALIIFRIPAGEVRQDSVWPGYTGDYGLRLVGFDRPDTALERTLMQLEATIRQDAGAIQQEWERIDQERARRPRVSLRDQISGIVQGMSPDVPPAALADILDQWEMLKRDCWNRAALRRLCQDALFCLLPDGPHHNEVSVNALHRTAHEITETFGATLNECGLPWDVIENTNDEYLLLSDLQRKPLPSDEI